jgi:glycogen(starch) synthase
MKIAAIVPEYPPHEIGGGGVAFEGLARAYLADGHQVKVFTGLDSVRSWFSGPVAEERSGIRVVRYPLIPPGRNAPYLRSIPPPGLPAVRLRRDLREWGPDVAHVHGYGHAFVDLAARFLWSARVPYIFTIHGLPRTPHRKSKPIRAGYSLYRKFGPDRTLMYAANATAVSEATARELRQSARVAVIPNGLTPLPAPSLTGASTLRRRFAILEDVPVIVSAGRLTWSKGFDVLIEALAYLPMSRVACVVAGADAGERQRLEARLQRCADGIQGLLVGEMDRQGVADLFSIASTVVIPSRDEPFGLVGLEALASGHRIVASRVGGLVDFLRPPMAELVPPGEPEALARALSRAILQGPLSEADLRVADGIIADHSWSRIAARYESLLEGAIRGSHENNGGATSATEERK